LCIRGACDGAWYLVLSCDESGGVMVLVVVWWCLVLSCDESYVQDGKKNKEEACFFHLINFLKAA